MSSSGKGCYSKCCRCGKRIKGAHALCKKCRDQKDALLVALTALETELESHRSDLELSFGLEYSSVVDWVADLTPRRGHPKAREYGQVWRGKGSTAAEAISKVIQAMHAELRAPAAT